MIHITLSSQVSPLGFSHATHHQTRVFRVVCDENQLKLLMVGRCCLSPSGLTANTLHRQSEEGDTAKILA